MSRRFAGRVAALLAAVTCVPGLAHADLRAEQITHATADELLIGGTQAVGGVSDWYLANEIVEVIVDDPARREGELPHGGTLVDAGLRDRRDEDQLGQVLPVLNLDQRVQAQFDTIRAEVDPEGGWARLVVSNSQGIHVVQRGGGFDPQQYLFVPAGQDVRDVRVETEYKVVPGEPYVHITTTIHNGGALPAPIFAYSDAIIHGGRSTRAWFGHTILPARTRGFHHIEFTIGRLLRSPDAVGALTYAAFPGVRQYPPIAYGLADPERTAAGGVLFGVTDGHVGALTVLTFDHDWPELTLGRLLRASRHRLAPGATWTYHRLFFVGGRHDVAAITDQVFPLLGYADGTSGVHGRVAPADVPHVIHVRAARSQAPITQLATLTSGPDAGLFRAAVPPGRYTLEVHAPQRPPEVREVRVDAAGFVDAGAFRLAEPGRLRFNPAFADHGPGRVVVQGEGDTPDPVFQPEMLDFRIDDKPADGSMETRDLYFTGTERKPVVVAIPPGRYRLTATRGLEYGVEQRVVTVDAGGAVRVAPFTVPRVIDLPGYVTADFHVHGAASDDTSITNEMRLRTFVAEGVDVLASTEHDNVGNFAAALTALRVADRIRVLVGTEITGASPNTNAPWTIGHSNAWPIPYDAHAPRHGAPPHEGMSLADAYDVIRREHEGAVIQLNHPRPWTPELIRAGSYFSHLGDAGEGFDPEQPLTAYPNNRLLVPARNGPTRAIDFDAMEVLNWRAYGQWLQIRRDWYALLRQGYRRTGVANSDTHGPDMVAAYPRTYVYYPPGLAQWDDAGFNDAVRAGRAFGTTGPLFVRFAVNGGSMGDVVPALEGTVTVGITVAAAPWIPVDEVRLVVNGDVIETFRDLPGLAGAPVVRLDRDVQVPIARDSFITLEAGVPLHADPTLPPPEVGGVYGDVVVPRFLPVAFTNPIFIDANGNGRFDPPGLPAHPTGPATRIPAYVFGAVLLLMLIAVFRYARRDA